MPVGQWRSSETNGSGLPSVTLLARLERERDNLRAALDWCLEEPNAAQAGAGVDDGDHEQTGVTLGVRLAAAIWRFWWLRGHTSDGRRLLARVLEVWPQDTTRTGPFVRAFAPLGVVNLSSYQGGNRVGAALMAETLALYRESGDQLGVATALAMLGSLLAHLGEFERAAQLCEESVALGRRLGHPFTLATALQSSALVAYILRRYEQSVALSDEALSLHRSSGNVARIAAAFRTQSLCIVELGDLGEATRLAEEGLRYCLEIGDRRGICLAYKNLGRFAMLAGDLPRASELLHDAISLAQPMGDRWRATICIFVLAGLKVAQGTEAWNRDSANPAPPDEVQRHLLDATRLFAMADQMREQDGMAPPGDVANTYDRDIATLRELLGDAAFSEAQAEGQALSFEQAVAYALATSRPAGLAAPEAAHGSASTAVPPRPALNGDPEAARLSPREREVAVLVARGCTNREIAEVLVLSERTVDSHVRNIMGKLAVSSRAQIAAWAVQHGLGEAR